ncbi:glycosyl hydrolase 2 galactose-binding domain-containing protein [Brachybacterium sp. DNPG3]
MTAAPVPAAADAASVPVDADVADVAGVAAVRRTALHSGWTVSVTDGPAPFAVEDVPATVPGTFILDLMDAGLAADPYLDRNEHELAWTGECDVLYRTTFAWEPSGAERIDLVARSLDTAATVVLNGRRIAEVQNEHRSWRFDVTDQLVAGDNALEIRFASPLRTARENEKVFGEMPKIGNALPYNAIRKMACNMGWDWGPVLVTSGIAGPIGLEEWSSARLAELRPQVTVDGLDAPGAADAADATGAGAAGAASVVGRVELAAVAERADLLDDAPLEIVATLADPSGEIVAETITSAGAGAAASATGAAGAGGPDDLALSLVIDDPQLWWPRGYGEQPLYTVRVILRDADGVERDVREHRVGFRTAGVVEEPDEIGTGFQFVVNGQSVLAKGANWIPDDCFPVRLTDADYRAAIQDAVDADMNILRVWGGGLYAADVFYDLCDELGLLVWQDFAMACAAYSELEPLRSEIEAEAREHIVRLAWHPALAHWNGSNENVEGYYHWGWKETLPEGTGWGLHYYMELLPALLAELDPTRSYTPTSPYSRPLPEDPRNPDHGSIHNWVAWASDEDNDYERYRDTISRFSAEFGYQGPANFATVARAISERPLVEDSPTMLSHQKAIDGQDKLERGYAKHLPRPEGFDDFHCTTQLNQARALICGIGHYRSHWPVCGGTIVWQLNDCWPVTSWAAVDGDRRRKLLWYALRHLYRPLLVTVQPRPEGLVVSLGNDRPEELATTLRLRRQTHAGEVLAETAVDVRVPARSAGTIPVPAELATPADAASEVLVATLDGHEERTVEPFAEDVDSALPADALTATARAVDGGVEVHLEATGTVRDVCVLADKVDPDAVAEQQLVTLLAGESATIVIRTSATSDPERFVGEDVLYSANDLVARARARDGGEAPADRG